MARTLSAVKTGEASYLLLANAGNLVCTNDAGDPTECCCRTCQCLASPASQMQVVIASMGEAGCGSCSSLNGTYVLDFQGEGAFFSGFPEDTCGWKYTLPSAVCTVTAVWLLISSSAPTGGGVTVTFYMVNSSGGVVWGWAHPTNGPDAIDCAFDNFELATTVGGNPFLCNHGTCHATAL